MQPEKSPKAAHDTHCSFAAAAQPLFNSYYRVDLQINVTFDILLPASKKNGVFSEIWHFVVTGPVCTQKVERTSWGTVP